MQKPETKFRNRIRPLIEKLPNTVAFPIQQSSINGTPDYLLCISGVFVGLELKASKEAKVSSLQSYNLKRINHTGKGLGLIAYPENWDEIYSILKQLSMGCGDLHEEVSIVN